MKEDKRVKVIRNPQNLGAPAAFNQGIFATSHEKII
ncbi:MAG: glycosyltransferase family 2 protein, partial [Elusimicrobia bacterium]|nr:glycosyltransferase family 2 protein [Elusimicrobiota bacterium]